MRGGSVAAGPAIETASAAAVPCRVCGTPTEPSGTVRGRFVVGDYHLRRCPGCGLAFVGNPLEDLDAIYSMAYYEGRGADPLVDYVAELREPERTVRHYEWEGIVRAVRAHKGVGRATRWLDFGCGTGGLVRHLRSTVGCPAVGYDEGAVVALARDAGVPIHADAELDALGPFDVVTAIEVLEHLPDPSTTIGRIAQLLAPGGTFFYTTGNAVPFNDRLARWRYVIPEIHISLYEPRTLEHLLRDAGLEAVAPRFEGWREIYWYKLLKNLGVRRRNPVFDHMPQPGLARALERRLRLAAFPLGRRPPEAGAGDARAANQGGAEDPLPVT